MCTHMNLCSGEVYMSSLCMCTHVNLCREEMYTSSLCMCTCEPVQRGDVHEFTVYVLTCEPVQRGRESTSDELKARRQNSRQAPPANTTFKCSRCDRDCDSRISLHSHSRCCTATTGAAQPQQVLTAQPQQALLQCRLIVTSRTDPSPRVSDGCHR